MNKAVFLDRDGVINVDKSYVYKIEDFEFCEGVFEALKHFVSLGYKLVIVTNQSGIGRGYYKEKDFEVLTQWMCEQFYKEGIEILSVYHCPHLPDALCECRKPKPKMLNDAMNELQIDASVSWMIGDKKSDIEAGINAGISQNIFVNTFTSKEAKYSVQSILDTIPIIIS